MKHIRLWKCEGGYAVMNPADSDPYLCDVAADHPIPLLRSDDGGKTWQQRGVWHQVGRFKHWEVKWDDEGN